MKHDLPEEARAFLKQAYPAIKTIEKNLEVAQKNGYHIINCFALPSKGWWENYYIPIEAKLSFIKTKYKNNKILEFISLEETEIEMFRSYSDYYGYVFYIMQII